MYFLPRRKQIWAEDKNYRPRKLFNKYMIRTIGLNL